jgi:flagellar secretion chaperone FliS
MSIDPKKKPVTSCGIDAYKKAEILTANRETILLLLYQGAIRFLQQAIAADEREDLSEKVRLIGRTQDIVTELRATLDFKTGGELAENLDGLYGFVTHRLTEATLRQDSTFLKEALQVLVTLNSGWEQAIASLRKTA